MLERKLFTSKEEVDVFTCCAECTINYEKEAALFKSGQHIRPSWLISQSSDYLQRVRIACNIFVTFSSEFITVAYRLYRTGFN